MKAIEKSRRENTHPGAVAQYDDLHRNDGKGNTGHKLALRKLILQYSKSGFKGKEFVMGESLVKSDESGKKSGYER